MSIELCCGYVFSIVSIGTPCSICATNATGSWSSNTMLQKKSAHIPVLIAQYTYGIGIGGGVCVTALIANTLSKKLAGSSEIGGCDTGGGGGGGGVGDGGAGTDRRVEGF